MQNIKNKILELNKTLFKDIVSFRRHIHKNPELSYKEFETASFVKDILTKNNIEIDNSYY